MKNIYESSHYKRLLLIPLVFGLFFAYFATQITLGQEFTGGVVITAPAINVDSDALKAKLLSLYDLEDLSVRVTGGTNAGVFIEFTGERTLMAASKALEENDSLRTIELSKHFTGELNMTGENKTLVDTYYTIARQTFKDGLINQLSAELNVPASSFSFKEVGASLGRYFWSGVMWSLTIAFVFITALIFFFFRNFFVSIAVVQSAFFDVLVGFGTIGLLQIPLSLAMFAPLLMLVGYSVDSDIVLTERVLKRKEGTPVQRLVSSMKTALTMTGTSIAAIISLCTISYMANITVLFHISIILLFGLVGDVVATWCTNAVIVLHIANKRVKK